MAKKASGKARKKVKGQTRIELDILNPEKFQTLQEIRDFITGDGSKARRFAIGGALAPGAITGLTSEIEVLLRDQMEDARQAAFFVSNDLGVLATAAVELERDPHVFASEVFNLDKERRTLSFIARMDGGACGWVQQGIIEYLGSENV